MNKFWKTIATLYVITKVAPVVVKGVDLVVDVLARGIVSKVDDLVFGDKEDSNKEKKA